MTDKEIWIRSCDLKVSRIRTTLNTEKELRKTDNYRLTISISASHWDSLKFERRRETFWIYLQLKVFWKRKYYLPLERNVSAKFVKDFIAGRKGLLKINDVKFVVRFFRFQELSLLSIMSCYPRATEAKHYLPDINNPWKLDRLYCLNVGWLDS